MKRGILGLGEAGSKLANDWASLTKDEDAYFGVINTTEADGEKATNVENKYLILNGELGGLAKESEKAANALQQDGQNVVGFIFKTFIDAGVKYLTICTALAGGSGSGVVRSLVKVLKANTNLKIRVIGIAPFDYEDSKGLENTLVTASILENENIAVRIPSNDLFKTNISEEDKYKKINKMIATQEEEVYKTLITRATGRNTDLGEVEKVMYSPGYSTIFSSKFSDNIKATEDILSNRSSIDCPTEKDGVILSTLTITKTTKKVEKLINKSELAELIGRAQYEYHTSYESNKENEVIAVYGGMSFPETYLGVVNEKLLKIREGFGTRKSMSFDLGTIISTGSTSVIETKNIEIPKVELVKEEENLERNMDNWFM